MLARLIDWSLRNVFLVLLATAFAVAAGVYAVARTPVDAIISRPCSRHSRC